MQRNTLIQRKGTSCLLEISDLKTTLKNKLKQFLNNFLANTPQTIKTVADVRIGDHVQVPNATTIDIPIAYHKRSKSVSGVRVGEIAWFLS